MNSSTTSEQHYEKSRVQSIMREAGYIAASLAAIGVAAVSYSDIQKIEITQDNFTQYQGVLDELEVSYVTLAKDGYPMSGPQYRRLDSKSITGVPDSIYLSLDYLFSSVGRLLAGTNKKSLSEYGLILKPYLVDETISNQLSDSMKIHSQLEWSSLFADYKATYPLATAEQFDKVLFKDSMNVAVRLVYDGAVLKAEETLQGGTSTPTIFNYSNICPPNCSLQSTSQFRR